MGYDENSIQVAANHSGSARRRERRGHFRAETNRQNGSCVDTDKDGDNVFITFDDKNLYYSGGTGKYKGITGTAAYTYVELHGPSAAARRFESCRGHQNMQTSRQQSKKPSATRKRRDNLPVSMQFAIGINAK